MITVYSDDHNLHCGLLGPRGDAWAPSAESPLRANNVIKSLREQDFGEIIAPKDFGDEKLLRIHEPDYLQFLKNAWVEWEASNEKGSNARPDTFVGAGMRYAETESIVGKLGRYSFDATSPFVAGSWQAIRTSANIALTGAELIRKGERAAFAACRPPGHHATTRYCGGYCYLNNNSLAAQSLIDSGAKRVVILDVDYHHGNGTQTIFYGRNDVLTISLHADPKIEYPFFLGYEDEPGEGQGHGFNINYPLPFGTDWDSYRVVLNYALQEARRFAPDALVVALGLDTFAGDPTTFFEITTADFQRMGAAIGELGLPTLVVLEGGYSVDWIGQNTLNFLTGLETGREESDRLPSPMAER
ncbi:MAG: histone deacetylase family protein [Proteobacteria bacterium]|nr:histone deacetylase family protein [Pseudomonadota bacterium]MDA0992154.1 histone deacetylase family protein [Pseudomonadota bacterium]